MASCALCANTKASTSGFTKSASPAIGGWKTVNFTAKSHDTPESSLLTSQSANIQNVATGSSTTTARICSLSGGFRMREPSPYFASRRADWRDKDLKPTTVWDEAKFLWDSGEYVRIQKEPHWTEEAIRRFG